MYWDKLDDRYSHEVVAIGKESVSGRVYGHVILPNFSLFIITFNQLTRTVDEDAVTMVLVIPKVEHVDSFVFDLKHSAMFDFIILMFALEKRIFKLVPRFKDIVYPEVLSDRISLNRVFFKYYIFSIKLLVKHLLSHRTNMF